MQKITVRAACGAGPSGPNTRPEQQKWVAATLARLSREEKVGQMIVVRTYGDFLNWDTGQFRRYEQMVTGWKIGGFVLGNRMNGTAVQPGPDGPPPQAAQAATPRRSTNRLPRR